MQVRFNETDEFIQELRKEYPDPYGGQPILRISGLTKRTSANSAQLYVFATILNPRGEIVRLEKYCGTLWPIPSQEGEKAHEVSKTTQAQLELAAKELNLEVRAGVFEGGTLDK